jgi:hypothetical protein
MKVTDDYLAKIKLWAANPRVVPLPPGPPIPKFRSRKFRSYSEFNAWKQELILQIAREQRENGRNNPPV